LKEKTGENCLNNSLIAFFPVQIFHFTQVRHGKGKKAVLDSKILNNQQKTNDLFFANHAFFAQTLVARPINFAH